MNFGMVNEIAIPVAVEYLFSSFFGCSLCQVTVCWSPLCFTKWLKRIYNNLTFSHVTLKCWMVVIIAIRERNFAELLQYLLQHGAFYSQDTLYHISHPPFGRQWWKIRVWDVEWIRWEIMIHSFPLPGWHY